MEPPAACTAWSISAPGRVAVPLKSMCSSTCDRPAPSQAPSSMLPARHHAWALTTGALWSSRRMSCSPLSRVSSRTPGGTCGMPGAGVAADWKLDVFKTAGS